MSARHGRRFRQRTQLRVNPGRELGLWPTNSRSSRRPIASRQTVTQDAAASLTVGARPAIERGRDSSRREEMSRRSEAAHRPRDECRRQCPDSAVKACCAVADGPLGAGRSGMGRAGPPYQRTTGRLVSCAGQLPISLSRSLGSQAAAGCRRLSRRRTRSAGSARSAITCFPNADGAGSHNRVDVSQGVLNMVGFDAVASASGVE